MVAGHHEGGDCVRYRAVEGVSDAVPHILYSLVSIAGCADCAGRRVFKATLPVSVCQQSDLSTVAGENDDCPAR